MEPIKITLSNNVGDSNQLVFQEVIIPATGRRMIAICNGTQQINLTQDEADSVGLVLLRLSMEAKVRNMADDVFKSTQDPIRTRLKGIVDRRANMRGPYRRLNDKRRSRLGSRA